jgi:hypothetical protein
MNQLKGIESALIKRANIKKVKGAMAFLAENREFTNQYADLDAFVFHAPNANEKLAKAIEHHLIVLRRQLLEELWSRHLFLSINTIEQLLYASLKVDEHPFVTIAACITSNGLHHPGFVLYPLHSFGFLGAGLFSGSHYNAARLNLTPAGIALTPQTNSAAQTVAFLQSVTRNFRITQGIPRNLLDHLHRSRSLRWYTNNPLLAVRIASYTSGYYENQRILILKLRMSTTLIAMMAVMGRQERPSDYEDFSTAKTNNWETLDIAHYLLFQANPAGTQLSVDCTPMHADRLTLAELSDLGVDIDARAWKGQARRNQLNLIRDSLGYAEDGYLRNCILGSRSPNAPRLFRKLESSISYFCRSLRSRGQDSEKVVALAIAFETLLMDYYSRGVTKQLLSRVKVCLKGKRGVTVMCDAINELFVNRGKIVHAGEIPDVPNIWIARKAYIYCFIYVMQRLKILGHDINDPLRAMFSDSTPDVASG